MNPKWIIGLSLLFIVGNVLCSVLAMVGPLEGAPSEGHTATYWLDQCINNFSAVGQGGWHVITGIALGIWSFLMALANMFIWNYSFFEGYWQILRWVVFMPISVGLGWIILSTIIPPIVSTIATVGRSVFGWLGGLFG